LTLTPLAGVRLRPLGHLSGHSQVAGAAMIRAGAGPRQNGRIQRGDAMAMTLAGKRCAAQSQFRDLKIGAEVLRLLPAKQPAGN
jgi:hypothetical protein